LAAKFRESADSHFCAVSNEKRVRVEASKKRLTIIRPRKAGTFFISRWPIDDIDSAVSRISAISSGESGSMPRRSLERRELTRFNVQSSKFKVDARVTLNVER